MSVDFEALRMRQRSWCGEGAGGQKIPALAKLGRGTRGSGAVNLGHPPNRSSYRFYLLDEAGPVRVNQGWTEISFRAPAA